MIFFEIPAASIGAYTGVQWDFIATCLTKVISVLITNQTRPLADPRDAFVTTGPSAAHGVTHGVKHISSYNEGSWRFDPPLELEAGTYFSGLHHCEQNDVVGIQIESDNSLKYLGRTVS